jgi:hypothetical protein
MKNILGKLNIEKQKGKKEEEKEENGELKQTGLAGKLTEKVRNIFQKPEWKNKFFVEVFLGSHESKTDAEKLKERLKEADILVLEGVNWTKEIEDAYKKLSGGEKTPKEFFNFLEDKGVYVSNKSYEAALIKTIYNSKKEILFADIPFMHKKTFDFFNLTRKIEDLNKKIFHEDFQEVFNLTRYISFKMYQLQESREKHFVQLFEKKLKKLLIDKPELLNKNKIKILINFGVFHTKLPERFAKREFNVKRFFAENLHIFDFTHEILRRHYLKKEVNNELIARALLERMIFSLYYKRYKKSGGNDDDFGLISRSIAEKFDYAEIEKIYNEIKADPSLKMAVFQKWLSLKNLRFPKSKEEEREFIKGLTAKWGEKRERESLKS